MCHPYRSTIVSNRDRGNKPMVSDVHSDIPPHDDRAGPGLIAAFSFGWKALALRGVVSIILGIVALAYPFSALFALTLIFASAYLRAMTRNIVALSGTYSALSADRQFQELLSIVHPTAYNGLRDSLNGVLDELANNPTLSIATYIRPDQPVTWTDRQILVPVEKIRVIGGVIRKFRGNLRIRYTIDAGRFWILSLTEEKFDAELR